jgi:hypothetical protein
MKICVELSVSENNAKSQTKIHMEPGSGHDGLRRVR